MLGSELNNLRIFGGATKWLPSRWPCHRQDRRVRPRIALGFIFFFAWQGARRSGDSESKWFLRSSLESLIRVARGKVILTCHTYIPSHVPKYGANSLAWEARCSPKDRAGCFCILFWAITCFLSSTLPHHGAQCHYFGWATGTVFAHCRPHRKRLPPPGLEPGSLGWEPSILTS